MEIAHLGSCHLEIVTWEVALGKMPLGKYLTPTISIYSYNILFKNQFHMYTVHGTMSNVDLWYFKVWNLILYGLEYLSLWKELVPLYLSIYILDISKYEILYSMD